VGSECRRRCIRIGGWSRLQIAYLTVGDEEARQLMQQLRD